jgi:hypothetical protein
MSIHAVAHGRVAGEPFTLTADDSTATVLLLRDGCACDASVEYEVFCRSAKLAKLVLERVREGDSVVVMGTLILHRVLGPIEDSASAARVVLEAMTIGHDLALEREPRDQ